MIYGKPGGCISYLWDYFFHRPAAVYRRFILYLLTRNRAEVK